MPSVVIGSTSKTMQEGRSVLFVDASTIQQEDTCTSAMNDPRSAALKTEQY